MDPPRGRSAPRRLSDSPLPLAYVRCASANNCHLGQSAVNAQRFVQRLRIEAPAQAADSKGASQIPPRLREALMSAKSVDRRHGSDRLRALPRRTVDVGVPVVGDDVVQKLNVADQVADADADARG